MLIVQVKGLYEPARLRLEKTLDLLLSKWLNHFRTLNKHFLYSFNRTIQQKWLH